MALLGNNTETLKKQISSDLTFPVMDYTTERSFNSQVIDFHTRANE